MIHEHFYLPDKKIVRRIMYYYIKRYTNHAKTDVNHMSGSIGKTRLMITFKPMFSVFDRRELRRVINYIKNYTE